MEVGQLHPKLLLIRIHTDNCGPILSTQLVQVGMHFFTSLKAGLQIRVDVAQIRIRSRLNIQKYQLI